MSTPSPAVQNPPAASIRRVALSGMIGTAAEWYDYFIYGTMAALVFNQVFFPETDPTVGTLLGFATFAVTFLMRPVGAAVFGHYGDRLGRKGMLIFSIVVMGVCTFAIGLLPTYEQIGIWAPILLVVLRMIQGFAVGGEYGGATTLTLEHAPADRRGFYTAISASGLSVGLFAGTIVPYAFVGISGDAFATWGWRIPFFLSAPLILLGLYIRLNISEAPVFTQMVEKAERARMPVVELFRKQWRTLALVVFIPTGLNFAFYIVSAWVISYLTVNLGVSKSAALIPLMVAAVVDFAMNPVFGALSDRWGRRPVYLLGTVWLALTAFPFFLLINTGSIVWITVAMLLVIPIGHGATYPVQAAYFAELFDTDVRYSGLSLGYHIGAALIAGPGPVVAAALLVVVGGTWPIAALIVVACGVSVAAVLATRETRVRRPDGRTADPAGTAPVG